MKQKSFPEDKTYGKRDFSDMSSLADKNATTQYMGTSGSGNYQGCDAAESPNMGETPGWGKKGGK